MIDINLWDYMFGGLSEMKATEYKEVIEKGISHRFYKNSKSFGSNLIKNILTNNDPMQLVIIGHLYFDYMFRRFLEEEGIYSEGRRFQSFRSKIDELLKIGVLSSLEYGFLLEINKLRNKFAHNVFFEVTSWDPSLIPQVRVYGLSVPKRKDLLRAFIIVIIQTAFFILFIELSKKNKWLYLEDVPKHS